MRKDRQEEKLPVCDSKSSAQRILGIIPGHSQYEDSEAPKKEPECLCWYMVWRPWANLSACVLNQHDNVSCFHLLKLLRKVIICYAYSRLLIPGRNCGLLLVQKSHIKQDTHIHTFTYTKEKTDKFHTMHWWPINVTFKGAIFHIPLLDTYSLDVICTL